MAPPDHDLDRLITDLLEVPTDAWDRWLNERLATDPPLRDRLLTVAGDSDLLSSEQRDRVTAAVRRVRSNPDPVPAAVGRYEVVRQLGEGGMGRVLLARDPNVGRLVAIKLVRGDFANDEYRKRFWREARAAGRLRHPNIVTVYDVDELAGEPFMVMEYIAGRTLAELIARRDAGTLARRLELVESLCAGLAAAHAASVVHRDVKPANLMVDEHGVLKILDFGVARPAALDTDVTTTTLTAGHAIIGTVGYIAPECFTGSAADARSDMFAAAIVAYELLAYDRPFGAVPAMMSRRALIGDVTPMRVANAGVPEEVERIVMRGLAVAPSDRFRDMAAMAGRIAEARRHAETIGDSPTSIETPIRSGPPRRLIAGAVGVAGLAMIGFLSLRTPPTVAEPEAAPEPAIESTEPVATAPQPAVPAPRQPRGAGGPASSRAAASVTNTPGTGAAAPPAEVPPAASSPAPAIESPSEVMSSGPGGPAVDPSADAETADGATEPAPSTTESPASGELSDDDVSAIRSALRSFEGAFAQRSTPELRRVHPTLTASELAIFERRFLDSESYRVVISDERLRSESPTRATVDCRLTREIVPVRGSPRRQSGRAAITLSRDSDAWRIASIRAPNWW